MTRYLLPLILIILLTACNNKNRNYETPVFEDIPALDTDTPLPIDTTRMPDEPEDTFKVQNYKGSVLPKIAQASSEYASRLEKEGKQGFIVVDKARMKVILYDGNGIVKKEYGMACAKNYGTKQKKADSRTPEGFFTVQGVYDSTDWLFTDDNGVTSKKKGQFGPRFIRLSIPTTSQIGIHGTCAPWSIGHRVSHGCIRITNENIMELVDLVHPGMPVIIIPGKRDRKVNGEEGTPFVYFPTSAGYDMTADERKQIDSVTNNKIDSITEPIHTNDSVNHVDDHNRNLISEPETPERSDDSGVIEKSDTVPNLF